MYACGPSIVSQTDARTRASGKQRGVLEGFDSCGQQRVGCKPWGKEAVRLYSSCHVPHSGRHPVVEGGMLFSEKFEGPPKVPNRLLRMKHRVYRIR